MNKIGIQGIEGSFSEQAAKSYCQKFGINEYELAYLVGSMNVLNSLSMEALILESLQWKMPKVV